MGDLEIRALLFGVYIGNCHMYYHSIPARRHTTTLIKPQLRSMLICRRLPMRRILDAHVIGSTRLAEDLSTGLLQRHLSIYLRWKRVSESVWNQAMNLRGLIRAQEKNSAAENMCVLSWGVEGRTKMRARLRSSGPPARTSDLFEEARDAC